MAKKFGVTETIDHVKKKTSISSNPSMLKRATMNKHKKRCYKPYRGQGR